MFYYTIYVHHAAVFRNGHSHLYFVFLFNLRVRLVGFFFFGYSDHRDLHVLTLSFPTRLSSDLSFGLGDADLDDAATRIAAAGFEASGQQCVSAQRVIVAADVYDAFLGYLVKAASALRVGDPDDSKTDLGPMVSLAQAERVDRKSTRLNSSH